MQPRFAHGVFIALLLAGVAATTHAQPVQQSWGAVDAALGRSGMTQPDGVRRYGFPRSDLHVQLDGVAIRPALALGSWLAFESMGRRSMVMGDLVLTPDEVSPVLSELLKDGIRVTAVHNHLLRSSPAVMYMHVMGVGDPTRLAAGLHSALALSHTPLQPPATSACPSALPAPPSSATRRGAVPRRARAPDR